MALRSVAFLNQRIAEEKYKRTLLQKAFNGWKNKARSKKPVNAIVKAIKSDPTVKTLNYNKHPNRGVKLVKSSVINSIYFGPSATLSTNITFDPAGTYGTVPGVSDWSNIVNLYDQYKVNKIKFTFRLVDTANTFQYRLLVRYNYNSNAATPTLTTMAQLDNVKEKVFTPTSPEFTYTVYPKVAVEVYNTAVLASESRQMQRMRKSDVSEPVVLYGLHLLGDTLSSTQTLYMDISMEMTFYYNK